MIEVRSTVASEQLAWLLASIGGTIPTEDEVSRRLSAPLLGAIPASSWVARFTAQAPALQPFAVTVVDASRPDRARARLATPVGEFVVTCLVDDGGRIAALTTAPFTGAGLTPRLPSVFEGRPHGEVEAEDTASAGERLILLAGVPGTGKSTLADGLARHFGIPAFAFDWVLGALTPFGGRHLDDLADVGEELLTTLAHRQLQLGQSAILDSPLENVATRDRWASLARHFGADLRVIVCVCGDDEIHQQRLAGRVRGIAGWHDAGNWDVVRPRRDAFAPWTGEHVLVVDAVETPEHNLDLARRWLGG